MMTEDLPMFDAYNTGDDAEMIEEDEFDYEMQEEPTAPGTVSAPMQEYDMTREDQADYEDVIQAEPIVEAPATVDVPIVEAEVVAAGRETFVTGAEMPSLLPTIVQPQPELVAPPPPLEMPIVPEAPDVVPEVFAPAPLEIPDPAVVQGTPAAFPLSPQVATAPPLATTSPVIHLLDLSEAAITVPVGEAASVPEVEAPVEIHHEVAQEPGPRVTEGEPSTIPAEVHEAPSFTSTVPAIPPVAFYFENQVFSLFASPEGEGHTSLPTLLLAGRHGLYSAPLSQLLREIKLQEYAYFPGIEECVLGLEYQELDLCIDENCKYADKYSLEDLSKALLACGHTAIEFNIFQLSDFEQSLLERLKGNAPVIAPPATVTQGEDTAAQLHDQHDTQAEQPWRESEEGVIEEAEPAQQSLNNEADGEFRHDTVKAINHERTEAAKASAEVDEAQANTTSQAGAESTDVSLNNVHPAGQTENEANTQDVPGTSAEHDGPEVEEADEEIQGGGASAPAQADNDSISSATLESTTHDEEPQYEVEEVEEVDATHESTERYTDAHQDQDAIVITEAGDDEDQGAEEEHDGQEQEYHGEDPGAEQTNDVDPPADADADSVEPAEQAEQEDELDNSEFQDEGEEVADDSEEDQIGHEVHQEDGHGGHEDVQDAASSSPLTEEEEFAEYDDDLDEPVEGQTSLTTVDPGSPRETTGQGATKLDPIGSQQEEILHQISPARERERSLSHGKRSLDEINATDTREYDDDDDYVVETKRARVQ